MSDINKFIKDENTKLYNLQSNMKFSERIRLSPKIAEIRFLLNLLKSSDLSESQKEEIKDTIEKATDKAEDESQSEREREELGFSVTSRIKPNVDSIPLEVKQKALMVKASTIYHDNNQDADSVNDFLEDNDINFSVDDELSTPEGLVLYEKDNPENVKIAFRGSRMNNLGDWVSNSKILVGQEESDYLNDDRFTETYNQIDNVKAKYNTTPNEFVGTSRGGTLAITAGDKFGVDTTTFNSFLGKNLIHSSQSSAKHAMWRTTDDLPSIALGFKTNTNNYDINTVKPLKKFKTPRQVHSLDNFTDTESPRESNLDKLTEEVFRTTQKHGEAVQIADVANFKEGEKLTEIKDLYNIGKKTKAASKNPLLAHDVTDDLYDVESTKTPPEMYNPQPDIDAAYENLDADIFPVEDFEGDLFFKNFLQSALDVSDQDLEAEFQGLDRSDISKKSDLQENIMDDLLNVNRTSTEQPEIEMKTFSKPKKSKSVRFSDDLEDVSFFVKDEPQQLIQKLRTKLNIKETGSKFLPKKSGGMFEDASDEAISALQEENAGTDRFSRSRLFIENLSVPEAPKEKPLDTKPRNPKSFYEDTDPSPTINIEEEPSDLTFTDYIKKFSPGDAKGDVLSTRMFNKSRHVKIWKELGGKFTDKEQAHLDSIGDAGDDDPFKLSQKERKMIIDATPEERQEILDNYHQDSLDAMKAADKFSSVENTRGSKTLLSNDIAGAVNPLNIGIGLIAGSGASAIINKIDPDMPEVPKQALIGGLGNFAGEGAVAALSGTALGFAGGGAALIGGATGGVAGYEAYKGLKAEGATDFEATSGAGAVGGLTTAFTSGLAAGALAGAPVDVETLGLASAGGALLGGGIGAASYVGTEEQKQLKDTFKKQGMTDLESDLASDSITGATIGAAGGLLFGPVGSLVGAGLGAGVGSLVALGGYAAGKIF